jgi:methylated-DNA-protein-cysteine methyltransferase related protein
MGTVSAILLGSVETGLYKIIYDTVRRIPKGKVATYGQVAALIGKPRAARLVGWALNVCPDGVPWQRVINHKGMISIENLRASKDLQAKLLKAEGVLATQREGNFWVDLKRFNWRPRHSHAQPARH